MRGGANKNNEILPLSHPHLQVSKIMNPYSCRSRSITFALLTPFLVSAAAFIPSHRSTIALHQTRREQTTPSSLLSAVESTEEATANRSTSTTPKNVAIILCPAQFCVPADYTSFLSSIGSSTHLPPNTNIIASRVAPLPRTEWIKVAKQLPTMQFINAELDVQVTLDWYFDAIERALAELFAECGDDVEVCLVGHSIGGWVARAYLGGMSG